MPPTRHAGAAPLTHIQSRRRSSIAKITKAKYTQVPTPARLTFYPNVTPTTYVSQEQQDAELDQLAAAATTAGFPSSSSATTPEPSSTTATSLDNNNNALVVVPTPALFPPSTTPSTGPTRKRRPPGKRPSQGYIPRPPNAFMLFRADFVRQKHVPGSVETNHGSLSKIIGSCWRSLPPKDKQHWEILARKEKQAHKERWPDYKFRPVHKKRKKAALAAAAAEASSSKSGTAKEDLEDFDGFSDEGGDDAEYIEAKMTTTGTKRKAAGTMMHGGGNTQTSSSSTSSSSKTKPTSSAPLTLDNAPPSAYPQGTYRFAYATLREQRQEFIIACLVQGIKKRPVSDNLLLVPVPVPTTKPGEGPQGGYLEDHVERWDKERGYASMRLEAEREDREEKERERREVLAKAELADRVKSEHGAVFYPQGQQQPPQVQGQAQAQTQGQHQQHRSFLGHRRSSSVPLPDEFVHVHHHGYMQFQQPQNPYAVGYYPQPQPQFAFGFAGNGNGYDHHQQQMYTHADAPATSFVDTIEASSYTPYTNSNWGTSGSTSGLPSLPQPLPNNNNTAPEASIALPSLPTAVLSHSQAHGHDHSSSSIPPPSPTPSSNLSSSSTSVYDTYGSARPSFSQFFVPPPDSADWSNSRVSLLGHRRASSAQPCLFSQYTSGVWGAPPTTLDTAIVTNNNEEQGGAAMQQEDMDTLEFDPSAVEGWNPNFSFGGGPSSVPSLSASVSGSVSGGSVHSGTLTPPLDGSSETTTTTSGGGGRVEFDPNFGFSARQYHQHQHQQQPSEVSSSLPMPLSCTTQFDHHPHSHHPHHHLHTLPHHQYEYGMMDSGFTNASNNSNNSGNNNVVGMTSIGPLDPLEASPISSVSSVSTTLGGAGAGGFVHAPQPIAATAAGAAGARMEEMEMEMEMEMMDVDVVVVEGGERERESHGVGHEGMIKVEDSKGPEEERLGPKSITTATTTSLSRQVDSAKVFTDLWKGLSSSQSFCMGAPLGYRASVCHGGDPCELLSKEENVSSTGVVVGNRNQGEEEEDEEEEEEDGEFEKALRKEHMELIAVGGC